LWSCFGNFLSFLGILVIFWSFLVMFCHFWNLLVILSFFCHFLTFLGDHFCRHLVGILTWEFRFRKVP
jgi:hypothetical protein